MNFSASWVSAASGLVWEFRKPAVPLTCSPSTSPVVMAITVLGGVYRSILGEKMRSAICVCEAAPSLASSTHPCISGPECQPGWGVSSWGMWALVRCTFTFWGFGAHHVCWSSLCGLCFVFWPGLEGGSETVWERGIRILYLGEAMKLKSVGHHSFAFASSFRRTPYTFYFSWSCK